MSPAGTASVCRVEAGQIAQHVAERVAQLAVRVRQARENRVGDIRTSSLNSTEAVQSRRMSAP